MSGGIVAEFGLLFTVRGYPVPFPTETWRAQLQGGLSGNLDVWNMVWNLDPGAVAWVTSAQIIADAVRVSVETNLFSGAIAAGFFTGTTFGGLNMYRVNNTGHAIDIVTSSSVPSTFHGTGTQALPTECAVCCSLGTGRPGRSYAGRSYLPGLSASILDPGGFITGAAALAFSAAVAVTFDDINSAMVAEGGPNRCVCVLSTKLGVLTPIQYIRTGNIMDVQRRRRNGGPEGYYRADL